jgi:small subunit ribosomal protein S16
VAADARAPRDGRFIEILGHYHPLSDEVVVKRERVLYWLAQGAQPTETARSLLRQTGVWQLWQKMKEKGLSLEEALAQEAAPE